MTIVKPTEKEEGTFITPSIWNQDVVNNFLEILDSGFAYGIDGGGLTIETGFKAYIEVPFNCTLKSVRLLGKGSGSIQVDIRKCTYSQFDGGSTHPVAGDSIFTTKPSINSGTKYEDTTLSGVTTTWTKGDILEIWVDSVTTFEFVALACGVERR